MHLVVLFDNVWINGKFVQVVKSLPFNNHALEASSNWDGQINGHIEKMKQDFIDRGEVNHLEIRAISIAFLPA